MNSCYFLLPHFIILSLVFSSCDRSKDTYDPKNKETYHTVIFDFDGAGYTTGYSMKVIKGEKITKPANPTKIGAFFMKWYIDKENPKEFDFKTEIIKENTVIYAMWGLKRYTVTYNTDGGSEVPPVDVEVNSKISLKPDDPTKDEYTFVNWYKDVKKKEEFNFATETIINEITIYAKWEINKYTVTYDTEGGSAVPSIKVLINNKISSKPTDPTKEGFTFVNWCKDRGKTILFDFTSETIKSNITIYAKWDINKYLINYTLNGGRLPVGISNPQMLELGTTISKLAKPIHAVLVFSGWFTDNGLATKYAGPVTSPITLYAKWEPATPAFKFRQDDNNFLTADVIATIDNTKKMIAFPMENGITATNLSNLTPYVTSFIKKNDTGTTDFLAPQTYTLTRGGVSEDYRVQVKITSDKAVLERIITEATSSTNGSTANLNFIDTSKITDMSGLFSGTRSNPSEFNGDLSLWDVSAVTNMDQMFQYAENFNTDISSWDVSSVTNMSSMFYYAENFNTDISSWDVSSVTNMNSMFRGATAFTSDLSSWDVSSVTNMSSMFYYAENFNADLSSWDVSSVTDMSWMFTIKLLSNSAFMSDLSRWDVSAVTDMSWMFFNASEFTSDLSSWDVSKVRGMVGMFTLAIKFNSDLSKWDVSKVTDMARMFEGTNFTSDLSLWDVSSVTSMSSMFSSATAFTSDLSSWDVSSVTEMHFMFDRASEFTSDLSSWDVSSVTSMAFMFQDASKFTSDLSSWDVSNVKYMQQMFKNAIKITSDLSSWNVSSVTNMGSMFKNASKFNSDLSLWNVSSVTGDATSSTTYPSGMAQMFSGASEFTSDLSSWDVSSVKYMEEMFKGASKFNSDLSSWDVSKVTHHTDVFSGATLMTAAKQPTFN